MFKGNISISELQDRMRPNAWSEKGFLGDTETLEDIIERDETTLAQLSVSFDEVADKLKKILLLAFGELLDGNTPPIQVGNLQISLEVYFGIQECPWGCPVSEYSGLGSVDFEIINMQTDEVVRGPGLIVHLIKEHHFFERIESPHRVEPEKIVRILRAEAWR